MNGSARPRRRTVVIVGAGPAGLLVGNALLQAGIDCLIVDRQGRAEVEQRVRAGLVEERTVRTLRRYGLAEGIMRRGRSQTTCAFRTTDESFVIDYAALNDGVGHRVYPQQWLVQELTDAFVAGGGELLFRAAAEAITPHDEDGATVTFRHDGDLIDVHCALVAGCDGRRGVSRRTVAPEAAARRYPYQWLSLQVEAPPYGPHLLYRSHAEGFAGQMPRTERETRYYLQFGPDEDPQDWSEARLWDALTRRLTVAGTEPPVRGPVLDRSVLTMECQVTTPMGAGPVYLAGDAAHTVPPTGAKGMNLAIADAAELAESIVARFRAGDDGARLAAYSDTRLPDVWRNVHFSDWLLNLINAPVDGSEEERRFEHGVRLARMSALHHSPGLRAWFARAYAGPAGEPEV